MALHTAERDPLEMNEPINSGYLRLDGQITKRVLELRQKEKCHGKTLLSRPAIFQKILINNIALRDESIARFSLV